MIAHLSDLHLGAHHSAVADSLVVDVQEADPALTVITGDLTMRARTSQFVQASLLLSRLPSPQLVVLGNHDIPLTLPARLRAPYTGYQAHFGVDLDPFLEVPGLYALGLNSMPPWRWKAGRVSRQQALMVRQSFIRAAPAAARLVALHHPLSSRGPGRVLGRGALLHALVSARVDLVLAGHTHRPAIHRLELPDTDRKHSVLEVTAGTATSKRDRGAGRTWTLIHIEEEAIRLSERHHTPSGWRSRGILEYPRQPRQ